MIIGHQYVSTCLEYALLYSCCLIIFIVMHYVLKHSKLRSDALFELNRTISVLFRILNVTCLIVVLFCYFLGRLFLFDFVFSNTDCGDCHTAGIRIAVLDYFQFWSNKTKSYLCYLTCFCLCAVYESADDTGLLMLLYILSANLFILVCCLLLLLYYAF